MLPPTDLHKDLGHRQALIVALAEEIASEYDELPNILRKYKVSPEQFAYLQRLPRFKALFEQFVVEHNKLSNATERLGMKARGSMELSMPNFHADMNDRSIPLNHRVELLKTMAKIGGVGERAATQASPTETFKITINLGADTQVNYEAALPTRVIQGEVVDA